MKKDNQKRAGSYIPAEAMMAYSVLSKISKADDAEEVAGTFSAVGALLCGFTENSLDDVFRFYGEENIYLLSGCIAAMLTSGDKCDSSMVRLLHDYLESGHYSDISELYRFLDSKVGEVAK